MKRIVCVGDSNALGVRTTRGFPEHLWELLHGGMYGGRPVGTVVVNGGIKGAQLVDVLRALPALYGSVGRASLTVIAAPSYDARGGGTPPREYRALLEQAVATARCYSDQVVLASPFPIAQTTVRGFARPARRWIAKAAREVEEVALEEGVALVRLHEMDPALLADGVHASPDGYRWAAGEFARVVAPLLAAA